MSRGAGKVERAIEAIFDAEPDAAFTTGELAQLVYNVEVVGDRHRVSVGRAAVSVLQRRPECRVWPSEGPGRELVYFNSTSVHSRTDAARKTRAGYSPTIPLSVKDRTHRRFEVISSEPNSDGGSA